MIEVELPDGTVVEFPEGTDDATITRALSSQAAPWRAQGRKKSPLEMAYEDSRKTIDPTEGETWGTNAAAGFGRSYYESARGIGQLTGALSDEDIAEARRLDAPLANNDAAKWGNMLGFATQLVGPGSAASLLKGGLAWANAPRAANVAGAVQKGFLPTTVKGATAQGAALGAMQPATSGGERLGNVAAGAGGAFVGAKAGNALAGLSRADAPAVAPQRAQAITEARQAGYVLPPSEMRPGGLVGMLEGASGKQQIGQHASAKNQKVTNSLARKALGLPDDVKLNVETLSAIRKQAGQAYDAVASAGMVQTDAAYQAALKGIAAKADQAAKAFPKANRPVIAEAVAGLDVPAFDAAGGVAQIGILRDKADIAYRAGDKAMGKAYSDASKALEDLMERHLEASGQPELLAGFRSARQTIAKTYTVQKALNDETGDVSAQALAAILKKGKPITGELKTAAKAGSAFKDATQALKTPPRMFSPWDLGAAGVGAGSMNGPLLAAVAGRPAVRSAFLTKPMQDLFARQATQGRSIPRMIHDPDVEKWLEQARRLSQSGGSGYAQSR